MLRKKFLVSLLLLSGQVFAKAEVVVPQVPSAQTKSATPSVDKKALVPAHPNPTKVVEEKQQASSKKEPWRPTDATLPHPAIEKFVGKEGSLRLFALLGVEYLPKTIVNVPELLTVDGLDVPRYKKEPEKYNALTAQYSKAIEDAQLAPLYLSWEGEKVGYGVRAAEKLLPGTFVGEYTGVLEEKPNVKDKTYAWSNPVTLTKAGKTVNISLDAKYKGNEMRFVNHSFKPNIEVKYVYSGKIWHVVYVVGDTAIEKDDELLVNYGSGYWNNGPGKGKLKVLN